VVVNTELGGSHLHYKYMGLRRPSEHEDKVVVSQAIPEIQPTPSQVLLAVVEEVSRVQEAGGGREDGEKNSAGGVGTDWLGQLLQEQRE